VDRDVVGFARKGVQGLQKEKPHSSGKWHRTAYTPNASKEEKYRKGSSSHATKRNLLKVQKS